MEAFNQNENRNVQPDCQAGQVISPAKADAIVNKALAQPSSDEVLEQKQREYLATKRLLPDTEVKPEEPCLFVGDVGILEKGDIHLMKGKPKSGKSTVLLIFLAALFGHPMFRIKSALENPRVLYIDTEMKPAKVKDIVLKVMKWTGVSADFIREHLFIYSLRKEDFATLPSHLSLLVKDIRPDLVFIDGTADFVASFNEEEECKRLVHQLMCLAEDYNLAILNLIHENKQADDHNAKGHLGSFLTQKSSTGIQCQEAGGFFTIKNSDSRHTPMPEWSFYYDANGELQDGTQLRDARRQQGREARQQTMAAKAEATAKERLDIALNVVRAHGGTISRKDLTAELIAKLGLDRSTISSFVTTLIKNNEICWTDDSQKMLKENDAPFI